MSIQQLTGSTEVADVGHTRADEHFVDLIALYVREQTRIVRIVWRTQDWHFDIRQIDVDHRRVLCVSVSFQQLRIRQPFFHALNTTLQRTAVAVAFRNHPLEQHDVGGQILNNRLFVQLDGTARSRTLGRGIGQLERLLNFQIRQTFNFQNAAREDVFLALLLNGQQTLFDGIQRDCVHQIAQSDARLHFAFEAHQHGFRHVERHHAGRCGKRHQTGARREGDTNRETGMRVTAGTHGVRQQHAVQPGVDNAVARTQGDTATVHNEVRQRVVRSDVNRLRICRSVAEGLHHQVRREAQARKVFQFITGHWTGGVLRAHGGHFRLAVRARTDTSDAAGATDHFLCQREAAIAFRHVFRLTEHVTVRQTQRFTRFGGQATANDQRNTATGTHFVDQHVGFQLEACQQFVGFVVAHFAFIRVNVNHVAHVQVAHVHFNWQSARIFHGVEEDWRNFAAEAQAAAALVRHVRNVVAHEPQHGVGGGFTGRTGTNHITDVGQRETFLLKRFDLFNRANATRLIRLDAFTGVFQHRQGVQGDIRTRPRVRSRREVIGVGFTGNLKDGHGNFFSKRRAVQEPFGIGPGLHHLLRVNVACFGFFFYIVEVIEHQQR